MPGKQILIAVFSWIGLVFSFTQAAVSQNDCPKGAALLAEALGKGSDQAESEKELRSAIKFCPLLADAHYNLGLILLQTGRAKEAIESFAQAEKLDSKSRYLLGLAGANLEANNPQKAEKYYLRVLEKSPNSTAATNTAARQGLSVIYYRSQRYAEAEDVLREAIQSGTKNPALYYNLGLALEAQGRKDEAYTSYQTAVEFDSSNGTLLLAAGRLALVENKLEQADKFLRLAQLHSPKDPGVWLNVAKYHDLKGQYQQATNSLEKALSLGGDPDSIEINQGIVQFKQGQRELALSKLKKAVESQPKSSVAHGALGWAYLLEEQYQLAEVELNQALILDRDNSFAASHLRALQEVSAD